MNTLHIFAYTHKTRVFMNTHCHNTHMYKYDFIPHIQIKIPRSNISIHYPLTHKA